MLWTQEYDNCMLARAEVGVDAEFNEMEALNLLYELGIDPDKDCDASETVNEVSQYLYYSLDEWGKKNHDNPAPQCSYYFGLAAGCGYITDRCCAEIDIESA